MIVKVQIPLASNVSSPEALVYDESRSFNTLLPIDEMLKAAMHGEPKKFFDAELVDDPNEKDACKLKLNQEVTDPGW